MLRIKNQCQRIHDELLIHQYTNFTQIQGRPTTQKYGFDTFDVNS